MTGPVNLFKDLPVGERCWLYGDAERRWMIKVDSTRARVEETGEVVPVEPGATYGQSNKKDVDDGEA